MHQKQWWPTIPGTAQSEVQGSWSWLGLRAGSGSAAALIWSRKISGGLAAWMPDGLSETERGLCLQACGCFRSTMNAAAQGFWPLGGRFGPGPHSNGYFFRRILPVPRSHHSPCCCPWSEATYPLHHEEEEEKWGDWGPLPAYHLPSRCWSPPPFSSPQPQPCRVLNSEQIRQAVPNYLTWMVQENKVGTVIVLGTIIRDGRSREFPPIISAELSGRPHAFLSWGYCGVVMVNKSRRGNGLLSGHPQTAPVSGLRYEELRAYSESGRHLLVLITAGMAYLTADWPHRLLLWLKDPCAKPAHGGGRRAIITMGFHRMNKSSIYESGRQSEGNKLSADPCSSLQRCASDRQIIGP